MKLYYRLGAALALTLVILFFALMVGAQPPIPHATEEGDDCLACHQAGVAGAPRLAADHLGRTNDQCRTCHSPSSLLASSIPHSIVGREDCLTCHSGGVGDTPPLSGNHVLYTNDDCQRCHEVAPGVEDLTPVPVSLTPTPTPHPFPAVTSSCTDCHKRIFADPKHQAITGQPLGDVGEGAELYAILCSGCHGASGEKKVGDGVAINSEEFFSRHDEASILIQIGEGTHGKMTGFAEEQNGPLSWGQILDLVAFISTWRPAPTAAPTPAALLGDADNGAVVYAAKCAACHGATGEGGPLAKEALNSPEYLTTHTDEDIHKAIAEGVPGTAMPAYADKLTPDEIADIIAFFRSWQ